MSENKQTMRWCFTMNNPGVWRPPAKDEQVEYIVWQRERGAEGTEHIQGYIRFKGYKRMTTAKKWLNNNGVHLEKAKGTEEQNRTYCTKEDTRMEGPFEEGTFKAEAGKQGARTDLTEVVEKVKTGATRTEIAREHGEVFIKYHQGITQLIQAVKPPPPKEREVRVLWLWGPTGTGKTHRVRHMSEDVYVVLPGRDPWGNYAGQKTIFFDEFDDKQWTIQDMNRYLDKWSCELNCRYYNKHAEWTQVAVASNQPPDSFYENETALLRQALLRRITRVVHVTSREQSIDEPGSP